MAQAAKNRSYKEWDTYAASFLTGMAHFASVTVCYKASLTDGAGDLPWSSGEWQGGFHHMTHTPT